MLDNKPEGQEPERGARLLSGKGEKMYYLIDNDPERRFDDEDELMEYCIPDDYYDDCEDEFCDYLDGEYGSINIAGNTYYANDILRDNDEGDYDDLYEEWRRDRVNSDREDALYHLRRAEHGDHIYVGNETVYVYDDTLESGDFDGDNSILVERLEETLKQNLEAEKEEPKSDIAFESFFQMVQ